MSGPGTESSDREAFLKGIDEFNRGHFFECHETWEDVWHGTRGDDRDFYQGLIQIAVGLYHLGNGNLSGGESQLEKGLGRLTRYPEDHLGIGLEALREEVRRWLGLLQTGAPLPEHPPGIEVRK
jgi:uncharacterized protein